MIPIHIPFSQLTPDLIFKTVLSQGLIPTGALLSLNSYENRVYEISLEEREPIVAKFYRPGRWSAEAILEEHGFVAKLAEMEVPVVAPLALSVPIAGASTLGKTSELLYAFYPKFRGRERPDLSNDDRQWLGRSLARLHNIADHFPVRHRRELNPDTYGYDSLEFILTQEFLPDDLRESIESSLLHALDLLVPFFETELDVIPVHGDCHLGNILWNAAGPHLLDFDDMVIAPPVQDVWMLFHGDKDDIRAQQEAFFKGYELFRKFDATTLILAEPLRTLRMIHYAAWIGKRYADPAFPKAFPYYRERRYWEQFLLSIKEQIALLQEL